MDDLQTTVPKVTFEQLLYKKAGIKDSART